MGTVIANKYIHISRLGITLRSEPSGSEAEKGPLFSCGLTIGKLHLLLQPPPVQGAASQRCNDIKNCAGAFLSQL
jgi:hypothetical protein